MERSGIWILVAATFIMIAVSAEGWMALNGGGGPEPAVASSKNVMGEPSIGDGGSDVSEPQIIGTSVRPGQLVNTERLPATIESGSSGSLGSDFSWVISLVIAASVAAVPVVIFYELVRPLRLEGE